jgi:hypothetical protein
MMLKAHFDKEETLEDCKMMGAMYVQAIVESLNERFHDLLVFNTSIFLIQSIIQVMKKII